MTSSQHFGSPAGRDWRGLTGYAFAISGAILFSSKAIVVKLAYGLNVDTTTLLALRMVCSLPFYVVIGIVTAMRRRAAGGVLPSLGQVGTAAAIGLIGYWLASYLDFLGLNWISATFERLILFTYPLFVVLMGRALFGHRLHRGVVPGILISYSGLALVFTGGEAAPVADLALGVIAVLGAAVSFALYQLLAKPKIEAIGSELFTSIAMTGASAAAIGVFMATKPASDLGVVVTILPHAAFLAVGATVVPSYLLNAALARISAQANSAIGMISPIATIVLAGLFLDESLPLRTAIGAALVIGGVACFIWYERRGK